MAPPVPSCSRAPVALPGLFRRPRCCAGAAGAANWGRVGRAGLSPVMLRETCSTTHRHTPFCVVRGIIACGSAGSHLITPSCVLVCCVGAVIASYRYMCGSVPHLYTSFPKLGTYLLIKSYRQKPVKPWFKDHMKNAWMNTSLPRPQVAFMIVNFIFSFFL